MSYHSGYISAAGGCALAFMLVVQRVFLTMFSTWVEENVQLAWFSSTVAGVSCLVMVLLVIYILQQVGSKDLLAVAELLLGKPGKWCIALSYILIFISNAVLLVRSYAENTLTTALPLLSFHWAILWYAFSAVIVCYFSLEVLARISYVILPLTILGILAICLLLYPFYIGYNLLPWQGYGIMQAAGNGLLGAGVNIGLFVLILIATSFKDVSALKKAVVSSGILALLTKIFILIIYIAVYGIGIGAEKTNPFFELSRLVYVNRYLQRIEALMIMLWVMVGLMCIAISIYIVVYLVTQLLDISSMRPVISVVGMIVVLLSGMPGSVGEVILLDKQAIELYTILGTYLIPCALALGLLWHRRKNKQCIPS